MTTADLNKNIYEEAIDYFTPYQQEWIEDNRQIQIWNKSRRTGGTETVAFKALLWGFETTMPSKDIWFQSADKKAAEEFIVSCTKWAKLFNYAAELVGQELISEDDEDKFFLKYELRIPLGNGELLRVNAMSSNINSFHGKQGFMIIDEMARHKDQPGLWEGAFPATIWGYPLHCLSTQKGKRFFYGLCVECEEGKHPSWGYHKVDIYKAVEDGFYDKIAVGTGLIKEGETTTAEMREAWIASIKEQCLTDGIFLEQFCCIAADDEEAFLSYELVVSCETENILWKQMYVKTKWNGENIKTGPEHPESKWVFKIIKDFTDWFNSIDVSGDLYNGWDTGRKKDLSVSWTNEKIDKYRFTRLVIALEKMPFWVQEQFAFAILQHRKMRRALFDATGIGAQLAENAKLKFGESMVEEVVFTGKIKEAISFKLKGVMQDGQFKIPSDRIIRDDFRKIKKETTATGAIRLVADDDPADKDNADASKQHSHADYYWAGGLCVYADSGSVGPVKIFTGRKRESNKITAGYL